MQHVLICCYSRHCFTASAVEVVGLAFIKSFTPLDLKARLVIGVMLRQVKGGLEISLFARGFDSLNKTKLYQT